MSDLASSHDRLVLSCNADAAVDVRQCSPGASKELSEGPKQRKHRHLPSEVSGCTPKGRILVFMCLCELLHAAQAESLAGEALQEASDARRAPGCFERSTLWPEGQVVNIFRGFRGLRFRAQGCVLWCSDAKKVSVGIPSDALSHYDVVSSMIVLRSIDGAMVTQERDGSDGFYDGMKMKLIMSRALVKPWMYSARVMCFDASRSSQRCYPQQQHQG